MVHTPSFHVLFPSGLSLLSVRVYDTDTMLSALGIDGILRGDDVPYLNTAVIINIVLCFRILLLFYTTSCALVRAFRG